MLPQDPMILLSYINTKLRDEYPSLEAFCRETGIDSDELTDRLAAAGFSYDPSVNRFR